MCQFISGIAVKNGEAVTIYTLPREDSHTAIRAHFDIRDDGGPGASRQTPVELVPVRGFERVEEYDFIFDDGRPDWWTDEMTETAKRELFRAARARWDGKSLAMGRDVYLGRLTSLAEGVSLKAGGNLGLGSLTSLPKGVSLTSGRDVYLGRLTSIGRGCQLSAPAIYAAGAWHESSRKARAAIKAKGE